MFEEEGEGWCGQGLKAWAQGAFDLGRTKTERHRLRNRTKKGGHNVTENSHTRVGADTGPEESADPLALPEGGHSRRDFLKTMSAGGAGLALFGLADVATAASAPVYVPAAKMMIMHDASRCIGCRRCETACTLFHDNKIQPSISRIKLSRNYNFGPAGPRLGYEKGQGLFGDFRLIADTCLQCAHPVPCATACPQGAIQVDPKTNARVVNASKCVGCQKCVLACPWAMPSYDAETKKSTKCDLCGGNPQCVKICPTGALSYVPWTDRSKQVPTRQVVPAYLAPAPGVAESCATCHTSTE
jgi:Fe-S-cluster-containing dehydrogenase component